MAFKYVKKDTFSDRLSPIVKLVYVLLSLILALTSTLMHDIIPLLIWLAFSSVLWINAKIELWRLSAAVKVLLATFIFIIVAQGFLYRYGETPIFVIGHYRLFGGADIGVFKLEGVLFGLSVVARVLTVVIPAIYFVLTTSLPKISSMLVKLRFPYKLSFLFITTVRFTPLVLKTFDDIKDAQKIRAFDIDSMNIITKVRKAYIPIVTPLVLYLLRRAMDLQIAIESRGFGAPVKRVCMEEVGLRPADYLMLAALFAVFATCIYVKMFYAQDLWNSFYALLLSFLRGS